MPTTNSLLFDDYDVSAHLSAVHRTNVRFALNSGGCRYVLFFFLCKFILFLFSYGVWCSFATATSPIDRCDVVCESTRRIQRTNKVSLFFSVGFSSRVMSLAVLFAVSFLYSLAWSRAPTKFMPFRIKLCW